MTKAEEEHTAYMAQKCKSCKGIGWYPLPPGEPEEWLFGGMCDHCHGSTFEPGTERYKEAVKAK